MNSDTIYVFDPTTPIASHSANSEHVLYVSAPQTASTGPTLQIVQGAMLPPVTSASPDSVPNQSHVLSVNAYPVSYTVVPSSNQAYDANNFDLARYAALGGPIPTGRPTFTHSFASQGQPPGLKAVPLYLLGPLSQEQQLSPSSVNSPFTPGYAYLESPYISGSPQVHTPHTGAATATSTTSQHLNIIPNIDQSRLTMLPVSASSPVHPLMAPCKAWEVSNTSLGKSSEPASPSRTLGLCESVNSISFLYPLARQRSISSTASAAQLKSPIQPEISERSPAEPPQGQASLASKKKPLPTFMGVRGFLAPPPLGSRIVPGTTTLLDIPPLALPVPRWGILPQATLLAESLGVNTRAKGVK